MWCLGTRFRIHFIQCFVCKVRLHQANRIGDSRKKSFNGIPPRPIKKAAFGARKVGTLPFPSARDPPFYVAKLYSGRKVLFDFITQKTISFAICALK